MTIKAKALFISHGGGPMPLLGDASHQEMIECLKHISNQIDKPSAIIVLSAHWEESVVTITSNPKPDLIYDYHGFPAESYQIKYPCIGAPLLADKLFGLLKESGVESQLEPQRGFDHGVFVPLTIMYPDADIPVVQLSLINTLDAQQHIKIGQIISELEEDNVLVLGSGFTFHNMNVFFEPATNETRIKNESFEQWLLTTCSNKDLDETTRTKLLTEWEQAPAARYCHPREEHLLPLHVCYGVGVSASKLSFVTKVLNKKCSMYLW